MDEILINKELNNKLYKDGFVKFKLFDNDEVKAISDFYISVKNEHNVKDTLFHTTLNTSNAELIYKINDFLSPIFEKRLKEHLKSLNQTIIGFLVKSKGPNSAVTIHQDWNYVDEEKFNSFSVWVSLQDTNILNGCMQIIPGSHKFYKTIRTSPNNPEYFHDYKAKAADYLIDVPTKLGECLIFNQSIIHASRKNLSKEDRVSCILGVFPKEAKMLHYYSPTDEPLAKIEQYEINKESMIYMKKDQRPPHSKFIKYVSYVKPIVSEKEFVEKCKNVTSVYSVMKNKIVNHFLGKSC